MAKRVLVPIDGSDGAWDALEHAVAEHPDAHLTLLYVINPVGAGAGGQIGDVGYAEEWYDAMTTIRDSKHTMFYFLSDGSYQWKSVMMFSRAAEGSQWVHDFYEEHGTVVQNVRNTVITSVMKFGTDPDVLDALNDL